MTVELPHNTYELQYYKLVNKGLTLNIIKSIIFFELKGIWSAKTQLTS